MRVDLGPSAVLVPLPWDSAMLDLDCRQLHLFPDGTPFRSDFGAEVERLGGEFLFTRVEAADVASLHAFQGAGFAVVESLVTFALPVEGGEAGAESLGEADEAAAVAIMRASFVDGRYLVDPTIPREVGMRAYETWASNAVGGRLGDAALGVRDEGGLAGFVTLSLDREAERVADVRIASVGLIAVRPDAQGRGVGRALMRSALAWCADERVATLTVGTQTSNVPAQRLYTGLGFRPILCEVSLRRFRPL